ncbi:adhesion G-protein coupled receptor D2 isoform X2 [Brienomyrus brachyistius]|nr:adhesion G-protein coupled receptor D2 isoform X2 [Brienomyrus brachyistius]
MLQGRFVVKLGGFYYEYLRDQLPWRDSRRACQQKSGSLAIIVQALGKDMAIFWYLLNVTQPAWIENKHFQGDVESFILEFPAIRPSKRTTASIHQPFPSLSALTVCMRLQLDRSLYRNFSLFSYSTSTSSAEFQIKASVTPGGVISLALVVRGTRKAYSPAFENDGRWHTVCVSWTGDGRKWSITADGIVKGQGGAMCSPSSIDGDGLFVIGQSQDALSNFSKEGFSGNITQLNIWERELSVSEIRSLEKGCSTISSGLVYKWNFSALEMDESLKTHWGVSCEGDRNATPGLINVTNHRKCITYNPLTGILSSDDCEKQKGTICQYEKDVFERLHKLIVFPTTSFSSSVVESYRLNLTESEIVQLDAFLKELLRVLATDPGTLTPINMFYLMQIVDFVSMHVSERLMPSKLISPLATKMLELASEVISAGLADRWMDLGEELGSIGFFNVIETIDKLLASLADVLSSEGKSFTFSSKNIDVNLAQQNLRELNRSCVFKSSTPDGRDEIIIPDTEILRLRSLGLEDVIFIHVCYRNLTEIQLKKYQNHLSVAEKEKNPHTGRLATAVISATVRDSARRQNIPVSVNYTLSTVSVVDAPLSIKPVCVFWNFSLMSEHLDGWSSEGCQVTHADSAVTSCFCRHTTNFAVLMNYMEPEWSFEVEDILTKLTFIGCGASLCALIVTLMLFTVLDIPKSDRNTVHRNLFVALAAAQIVLLCSGSVANNKVACTLVAALLHLFFMAAFSWMLVEGLLLWSKVVAVNLSEAGHMKYYYLIGWGLPVLVVAVTLASASGRYAGDGHCWLSVQNGVIWGFVGPVIFIIMVNVMVLTRVVAIAISAAKRRSIMLALKSSPAEQTFEQTRAAVKAVMVLLPILGLTWFCGVLVPFSIVMAFLFVILNSLQGLFIFLIYGVYNTEVRSTINKFKERRRALNFSNWGSSRPSSSMTSSRVVSTPLPGCASHSLDDGGADCPNSTQLGSQPTALDLSEDSYEGSVRADGGSQPDSCAGECLQEGPVSPALGPVAPAKDSCCVLHLTMYVKFSSCSHQRPAPHSL